MKNRYNPKSESRDNIAEKIIYHSRTILQKDSLNDIELFLDLTEQFGRVCARNISTSQIRAIYTEVKRLPSDFEKSKKRLNLLRPKLAYQRGRFDELKDLAHVLSELIKQVKDTKMLEGFKEFFEAIIAYHKAYGGKE